MRTKNSIKNLLVSLALGLIVIIINFIAQRIFVNTLGLEYLGLNGLLTNLVSMLSVVELGLSTAIVYHLYKPLRDKNTSKTSSIMMFYKKSYRVIALTILILGMALIPFLSLIIGDNSIQANIPVVYMLFIINVTVSYLLAYKRSILYADQKNYLVNIVHLIALVAVNALQIWTLLATQNYYLYLILKIASTLAENLVINKIVDRRYYLDNNAVPLDANTKKDIFTKIRGLLYHKAGEFLVLGSTNIIISMLLGIKVVGLYSNYLLIQTAISTLFSQMQTAITASIGNLLLGDSKKEHFDVFRRLHFAIHLLTTVCLSVFLVASGSLIRLWLGEQYIFSIGILIALSLNMYLQLIRSAFANFKNAAGIFYEDRFVPLIESVINVIASIILVQFIGLAGAFIGTALSSLALHCYSYPKFIYRGLFGRSYQEYIGLMIKNLAISSLAMGAAYFVSRIIKFNSLPIQLMSDVSVAVIVPCILLFIIYRKSEEYNYFVNLARKILNKIYRMRR